MSEKSAVFVLSRVSNEYSTYDILDRDDSVWIIEGVFASYELADKALDRELEELKKDYESEEDYEENCSVDFDISEHKLISE